jgi:hypothetical protein
MAHEEVVQVMPEPNAARVKVVKVVLLDSNNHQPLLQLLDISLLKVQRKMVMLLPRLLLLHLHAAGARLQQHLHLLQ